MIELKPMTYSLAHLFYKDFAYDAALFPEGLPREPFRYTTNWVNTYCEKQRQRNRIHLAILRYNQPVGEILFKKIDPDRCSCVFSIHLQNDSVKNQGIGTEATKQALHYAFTVLQMNTVYADALISNRRSRHVLEKSGYQEICTDSTFCYYECKTIPLCPK